jgi:hypothetical protein
VSDVRATDGQNDVFSAGGVAFIDCATEGVINWPVAPEGFTSD